jgi:tRNA (guanine37-N1)-methyltransferase
MVMKPEPFFEAVEEIQNTITRKQDTKAEKKGTRTILFAAKGKVFTQADARRLATYDRLILLCGRYEGVDERVAQHLADEEISIGEFVLTGGELPAMIVIDAVARLLPGVLGNETSAVDESHSEPGILEYPQYTKPEIFRDWKVPDILLSGHHAEIEKWRKEQSIKNSNP